MNETVIVESSGLYSKSEIHYLDMKSMEILKRKKLENNYFGEGCEVFINKKNETEIHQLTWRERIV